eukprot:gene4306-7662_t
MSEPNIRLLKPIYDCLDDRNHKQALKYIIKLEKTYSKSNIVKSLKALAISRQGEKFHNEAIAICDEVLNTKNALHDESVINTLDYALKQLQQFERLQKMYTEVNNMINYKYEEMGCRGFSSYVRLQDYKSQQQVATKLYSNFKDKKYLFWAVSSLSLQLPNENPEKNPLLNLSIKMLEKGIDEEMKNPEVIRLYLDLLDKSKNTSKILEILKGNFGKNLLDDLPFDRKQMIADFSKKREDDIDMIKLSNSMYKFLLEKYNSDEWGWWNGYLDTLFLILNNKLDSSTNSLADFKLEKNMKLKATETIDDAKLFIQELQKKNPKFRGPFLAEIELETKIFSSTKNNLKAVMDLLNQYFLKFGSKTVCFGDIKKYFEIKEISDELKISFLLELPKEVKEENLIYYEINIFKFKRLINFYDVEKDEKELYEIIAHLISKFFVSQKFRNIDQDQKVGTLVGDDYLIIISHYLIEFFQKTKKFSYLLSLVSLLEYGLKKNSENFQFKILLCRIYSFLGCIDEALDIFYTLDIKHIQWETLSYFVLHDVLDSPGYTEKSISLLEKVSTFISEHERETPELLVYNYQNETYSKIKEFNEFKEKLDYSLQFSKVKIFNFFLKLKNNNSLVKDSLDYFDQNLKEFNEIRVDDKLISNEDVECISIYNKSNDDIFKILYPKETKMSLQDRILNLKIFKQLPNLLNSSLKLYSFNEMKQPKKNKNPEKISITNLIKEEEEIFKKNLDDFMKIANEKQWNITIELFQISLLFYQFLVKLKNKESDLEEMKKLLMVKISNFSNLLQEEILNLIQKDDSIKILSNEYLHSIEFILGKQMNFFITIFPVWLNILNFPKKDLVKIDEELKSEVTNLKSKITVSIEKFKNQIEVLKKVETFFDNQDSLITKFSEKIKDGNDQKEFISFGLAKNKQLNHQFELTFSKVLRVVSDLLLEINTIRI